MTRTQANLERALALCKQLRLDLLREGIDPEDGHVALVVTVLIDYIAARDVIDPFRLALLEAEAASLASRITGKDLSLGLGGE